MNTLETLKAARELISDPKRWTQKTSARDSKGRPTFADEEEAVCWCAIGALSHVNREKLITCCGVLESVMPVGIATFNDSHTHEEVLALFDKAILMVSQPSV